MTSRSFQDFISAPQRQSEVRRPVQNGAGDILLKGLAEPVSSLFKKEDPSDLVANETAKIMLKSPEELLRETSSAAQQGGHPGLMDVEGDPEARAALEEAGLVNKKATALSRQRGKKRLLDLWRQKEIRRLQGKYPGQEMAIAQAIKGTAGARDLLETVTSDEIADSTKEQERIQGIMEPLFKDMGWTGSVDEGVVRFGSIIENERELRDVDAKLALIQRQGSDIPIALREAAEVKEVLRGHQHVPMTTIATINQMMEGYSGGANAQLESALHSAKAQALQGLDSRSLTPKAKGLMEGSKQVVAALFDNAIAVATGKRTLEQFRTSNATHMEVARAGILRDVPGFARAVIMADTFGDLAPNWVEADTKLRFATGVAKPIIEHMINLTNPGYSPLAANTSTGMSEAERQQYQRVLVDYYKDIVGKKTLETEYVPAITNMLGDLDDLPETDLAATLNTYQEMLADPNIIPVLDANGGEMPISSDGYDRIVRLQRGIDREIKRAMSEQVFVTGVTAGEGFEPVTIPGQVASVAGEPNVFRADITDIVETEISGAGNVRFVVKGGVELSDSNAVSKINHMNRVLAPKVGQSIRVFAHVQQGNTDYAAAAASLSEQGIFDIGAVEDDDGQ